METRTTVNAKALPTIAELAKALDVPIADILALPREAIAEMLFDMLASKPAAPYVPAWPALDAADMFQPSAV